MGRVFGALNAFEIDAFVSQQVVIVIEKEKLCILDGVCSYVQAYV